MDELDKKILSLLRANARMTVKEIAGRVSLTSPAVSERIRRLEGKGVIDGYTVRLNPELRRGQVGAYVSISVKPEKRHDFIALLQSLPDFEYCCQVTGNYSHMVKVTCDDIQSLERLIFKIQEFGQTNTQIVLATITALEEKLPV